MVPMVGVWALVVKTGSGDLRRALWSTGQADLDPEVGLFWGIYVYFKLNPHLAQNGTKTGLGGPTAP